MSNVRIFKERKNYANLPIFYELRKKVARGRLIDTKQGEVHLI